MSFSDNESTHSSSIFSVLDSDSDSDLDSISVFACHIAGCQKCYSKKGRLTRHLRTHSENRPFRCPDCTERFKTKSVLRIHKLRHIEKSYRCNLCDNIYRHKFSLVIHIRTHFNIRPFKCGHEKCEKKFGDRSARTVHIRRKHTKEKPYFCPYIKCEQQFCDSSSLQRHTKIHRKSKGYPCYPCKKKLVTREGLLVHQRTKKHLSVISKTEKKKDKPIDVFDSHVQPNGEKNPITTKLNSVTISTFDDEEHPERQQNLENSFIKREAELQQFYSYTRSQNIPTIGYLFPILPPLPVIFPSSPDAPTINHLFSAPPSVSPDVSSTYLYSFPHTACLSTPENYSYVSAFSSHMF